MNHSCHCIQDKLLLYVESEQNGTPELTDQEIIQILEHLNTCESCLIEKKAIERNVIRLQSVSVPHHSEILAARCLPGSIKRQRYTYSPVYRYAGSMIVVCMLVAAGYFAGILHQQSSMQTVSSQPMPMNVLFQHQNDLILSLETLIQQNGFNPQTVNGVTLTGLKQSAYVMQHIYESNSKDVVVSKSIRQLTEQNIQLLQSLTQYLEEYDEENALPMHEI
jgi:hypothetical protein